MNNKNIEWYFAVLNNENSDRYEEIVKHGGHIIEIYRDKNPLKYAKKVKKMFENYKFDIVHCNVANIGFFFLYYAKKSKVKVRILHSHGTVSGEIFSHRVRNDLIIPFTRHYANVYFACSKAAGKAMFKRPFYVVNNGIEYNRFMFDKNIRKKMRKELGLEEKIIIGNVGRLSHQKNQRFLIKCFQLASKKNDKLVLLLFGDGVLKDEYIDLIKELHLEEKVFLMGSQNNMNEYYNVFDLFVLPSNFEGLPVVGIEAQVNGLKCLFSDKITTETDITNVSEFLPINSQEALDLWAEKLAHSCIRKDFVKSTNQFEIIECAKNLSNKYFELIKRY